MPRLYYINNKKEAMNKIKKFAKNGIAFFIMAAAAICSGYHFRWPTNAPALTSFRADLTQGGDHTVIVDLGEQSLPKLLLQPGRLRVSGQLNATGDLANSQTSLLITIASSSEKISVRPGVRNMVATDQGYSYEVSMNPNPKPKPGLYPNQEQAQERGQGLDPKPNPGHEQETGLEHKPDRGGQEQEQIQMREEQGRKPGVNPKPKREQRLEQLQRQEAQGQDVKPNLEDPKPNPKPKPGRGRGQEPGTVPLSFELSIPYLNTMKHDIGSVIVKYIDKEQDSLQGQITFIIRNSRIGVKL